MTLIDGIVFIIVTVAFLLTYDKKLELENKLYKLELLMNDKRLSDYAKKKIKEVLTDE